MAKDNILLGEVAARGATMLNIRCGRCDRHGCLSMQRLLAEYGPDATVRHIMQEQIGSCPNRDAAQIQNRCDPYSPTLVQLFGTPSRGDPGLHLMHTRYPCLALTEFSWTFVRFLP